MAGSAKITTACDIEIAVDLDFLKWVSNKSVCNPEQRRRVGGSGDKALLPGGRRFFDFAQNDSCFARNDDFLYPDPAVPFGHPPRVRAAIDERERTMIYNMRIYDLKPGCVPQYMDAVREVALKIRQENGVKLAGWYYTDIGKLNRVVHIWAYDDLAHFDKARTAVTSDPRWARDFVSRVQGLIVRQQDMIMKGRRLFRRATIEPVSQTLNLRVLATLDSRFHGNDGS